MGNGASVYRAEDLGRNRWVGIVPRVDTAAPPDLHHASTTPEGLDHKGLGSWREGP